MICTKTLTSAIHSNVQRTIILDNLSPRVIESLSFNVV